MSFEIRKYSSADASLWDAFVKSAWNGVFLFERGFMDYHADRFEDFSLLAFSGDKLKAVLPANRRDEVLHRSEEHTSELQSRPHLVCRLLLEKKKKKK